MTDKRSDEARLVFVSHSSEDTWVARQIAGCILEVGAKPFLDEAEIEVGAEFPEVIRRFLGEADELVVLFTPWAMERPWVWMEIGAAWLRQIHIVVVLHGISDGDFLANSKAPGVLKQRNLIRLNDFDNYLEQLGRRAVVGSESNE
jgi:hypothetical protein